MKSKVPSKAKNTVGTQQQNPNPSNGLPVDYNPNSVLTNPVGWLGFMLGSSAVSGKPVVDTLGTTLKDSPITQSLEGLAGISQKLQDSTFWLNVGGLLLGGVFVIISANGLIKQELIGSIKAAI